jgi:hypothetical protein
LQKAFPGNCVPGRMRCKTLASKGSAPTENPCRRTFFKLSGYCAMRLFATFDLPMDDKDLRRE